MSIQPITLSVNIDEYLKNSPASKDIITQNHSKLVKNICQDIDACKTNKPYLAISEKYPKEQIQIETKYQGKHELIFSGSLNHYHISLVQETVQKFFYHVNPSFDLSSEAFNYFRRIPPDEWVSLARRIAGCREPTASEIDAFKHGCWEHAAFQEQEWPSLALKAFIDNQIDIKRISTLLLFDACYRFQPESLKTYQLHCEGGVDPQAEAVFSEMISATFPRMTLSDKSLLDSALRNLSPQDTQFFSYNDLHEKEDSFKDQYNPFTINQGLVYIVLPPVLLSVLFKTQYKENAIVPSPVLGMSLRDDFTHKTTRDVFIPCRYVTSPTAIHGLDINMDTTACYLHDCSHCLIESSNPDRSSWLKLAAILDAHHLSEATNYVLDRAFLGYLIPSVLVQAGGKTITPFQHSLAALIRNFHSEKETLDVICFFILDSEHKDELIRLLAFLEQSQFLDSLKSIKSLKNVEWVNSIKALLDGHDNPFDPSRTAFLKRFLRF